MNLSLLVFELDSIRLVHGIRKSLGVLFAEIERRDLHAIGFTLGLNDGFSRVFLLLNLSLLVFEARLLNRRHVLGDHPHVERKLSGVRTIFEDRGFGLFACGFLLLLNLSLLVFEARFLRRRHVLADHLHIERELPSDNTLLKDCSLRLRSCGVLFCFQPFSQVLGVFPRLDREVVRHLTQASLDLGGEVRDVVPEFVEGCRDVVRAFVGFSPAPAASTRSAAAAAAAAAASNANRHRLGDLRESFRKAALVDLDDVFKALLGHWIRPRVPLPAYLDSPRSRPSFA